MAIRRETRRRRGLVIGAGAALGGAWAVGALTALNKAEGFDPHDVDVVVGTSAGSVLAALIGAGVPLPSMVERLAGTSSDLDETAPVNPFDVDDHVHRALGQMPRPIPLPADLGLAVRTLARPWRHTVMTTAAGLAPRGRGNLAPVGELVDELTGGWWPTEPRTWIVAMDQRNGKRVVFGRAASPAVPIAAAVTASCSAPGYFPPTVIDGVPYVDGGAVSMTNADVLCDAQVDDVIILAPMGMRAVDRPKSVAGRMERRLRRYANRRLDVELGRLADAGVRVRVLAPSREDLEVIGANVMDPRRRTDVYAVAVASTLELLEQHPGTA